MKHYGKLETEPVKKIEPDVKEDPIEKFIRDFKAASAEEQKEMLKRLHQVIFDNKDIFDNKHQ